MKYCSNKKCKQINPQSIDSFFKDSSKKDFLCSRCKSCHFKYSEDSKEKLKNYRSNYRSKNKNKNKNYAKEYRIKNKEKLIIKDSIRYQFRKEKVYIQKAIYYSKNKEKISKWMSEYKKNNRGLFNDMHNRRRMAKLHRTPPWLTEDHKKQIRSFYLESSRITKETGIKHHVDHIVPLQGKDVSGLHVPWNLQILTAVENSKKKNKLVIQGVYDSLLW